MSILRKINQKNQLTLPEVWLREMGVHKGSYFVLNREDQLIQLMPAKIEEEPELSEKDWKRIRQQITRELKEADSFQTPGEADRLLRKHMKKK